MIRRDVRLADGSDGWMLIPQTEHARISAELAARCIRLLTATQRAPRVRDEALAAIRHHDDGWQAWEQAPRLDLELGRPRAFTELPLHDALAIWTGSIDAAAVHGPLAAWMVAGHFLRLADHSDGPQSDGRFTAWRSDMQRRQRQWLDQWRRVDPAGRTPELAAEALAWLWTFDEVSLWLCCTCAADERQIPCAPEPYCAGRRTPVEMELRAIGSLRASFQPWRFDSDSIIVAVAGLAAPVRRYGASADLLAAARPHEFSWRLESPQ